MNDTDGSNQRDTLANAAAKSAVRDMPADFAANLEEEIAARKQLEAEMARMRGKLRPERNGGLGNGK